MIYLVMLLLLALAFYWTVIRPEAAPLLEDDAQMVSEDRCPWCKNKGSLFAGPSGGLSQNIACAKCFQEFNIHHALGRGVFSVERQGLLTVDRAENVYGFEVEKEKLK